MMTALKEMNEATYWRMLHLWHTPAANDNQPVAQEACHG